jgi:hypothetical protein
VARLHHRKDVTTRPYVDAEDSEIALAWRRDLDDDRTEEFVGIVRGRTTHSSRGEDTPVTKPTKKPTKQAPERKPSPRRTPQPKGRRPARRR